MVPGHFKRHQSGQSRPDDSDFTRSRTYEISDMSQFRSDQQATVLCLQKVWCDGSVHRSTVFTISDLCGHHSRYFTTLGGSQGGLDNTRMNIQFYGRVTGAWKEGVGSDCETPYIVSGHLARHWPLPGGSEGCAPIHTTKVCPVRHGENTRYIRGTEIYRVAGSSQMSWLMIDAPFGFAQADADFDSGFCYYLLRRSQP